MSSRRGVSLIEVLVATVLLAVGIGGTLSALAASARLRTLARDREQLAAEALDRLAWFEARACAQGDTTEQRTTTDHVGLEWSVIDSGGRRLLRFRAERGGERPQRLSLRTSWQCG